MIEVDAPIALGTVGQGAEQFVIVGGKVRGPHLGGWILPVGGDWQTVRADGRRSAG